MTRMKRLLSWVRRIGRTTASRFRGFKLKWMLGILAGAAWVLIACFLGYELRRAFLDTTADPFGHARAVLLVAAAWIGLPFLIWRAWIAHNQANTSEDSHHTNVLTKSVELLGATNQRVDGELHPAVETRVGAIYALERLSKQSKTDYGRALETLSAYVREQCGEARTLRYEGGNPDDVGIGDPERLKRIIEYCRALRGWHEELRTRPPADRADVAIALTVLARRREGLRWRGPESNETNPKLDRINLQGARIGELAKALVIPDEDIGLSSASLDAADMAFIELSDDHPFVSAVVALLIEYGPMVGPRCLSGVNLSGATLRFRKFFPRVECADLSFADMEGARCSSGHFRGTILASANLNSATAKETQFGVAYARRAIFDYADLEGAEFNGALLQEARFFGANLSGSCFDGADLEGTVFAGALLAGTDLRGSKNLTSGALRQAFGTVDTLIPNDLERPGTWVDRDRVVDGWRRFREHHGQPVREEAETESQPVVRADIFVPPGEWFQKHPAETVVTNQRERRVRLPGSAFSLGS